MMDDYRYRTSVFDLPQLYTKPSTDALLDAIYHISTLPPTTSPPSETRQASQYLTNIVASRLRWIDDAADREAVWESASRALADMSGRTASGARNRRFQLWTDVEFHIYEPGVTEGRTGLRTWGAAANLARDAKRYQKFRRTGGADEHGPFLELGSGTGLGGMGCAVGLRRLVYCTDLPSLLPNLRRNVVSNLSVIEGTGGSVRLAQLDWKKPNEMYLFNDNYGDSFVTDDEFGKSPPCPSQAKLTSPDELKFSTIIASDILYSADHLEPLVKTITTWLDRQKGSRVLIQSPLRPGFWDYHTKFENMMAEHGLCSREGSRGFMVFDRDGAKDIEFDPSDDDFDDTEEDDDFDYWWTVWMWTGSELPPDQKWDDDISDDDESGGEW